LSQKELQQVAVISSCVKGDLAYASRGRPSHRRLPQRMRDRILHLARTTFAGFNDHHLCEKLVEKEGFSLGRETLRRLLRSTGIGSPRKRRAPIHRQRHLARAREGEMLLLDGSFHRWLEDRGPQLTLLGFLDDAPRQVPVTEFFPTEGAASLRSRNGRLSYAFSRGNRRSAFPRLIAFQSSAENPEYASRPGFVREYF
jgi:hypothetical protein